MLIICISSINKPLSSYWTCTHQKCTQQVFLASKLKKGQDEALAILWNGFTKMQVSEIIVVDGKLSSIIIVTSIGLNKKSITSSQYKQSSYKGFYSRLKTFQIKNEIHAIMANIDLYRSFVMSTNIAWYQFHKGLLCAIFTIIICFFITWILFKAHKCWFLLMKGISMFKVMFDITLQAMYKKVGFIPNCANFESFLSNFKQNWVNG